MRNRIPSEKGYGVHPRRCEWTDYDVIFAAHEVGLTEDEFRLWCESPFGSRYLDDPVYLNSAFEGAVRSMYVWLERKTTA
jgi:hypothetical protein